MDREAAALDLELEIRRQQAVANYAWARRIFRRLNRDPQTDIRLILEGVSHSSFRRHFGKWGLVEEPRIRIQQDHNIAARAQAHRFQQYGKSEADPYFVNRDLRGQLKPKKKKRKAQSRNGLSADYRFNDCTPREVTVLKEVREVSLGPKSSEIQQFCDFRRFQTKRHGAGAFIKVYSAGTIAFISRIRVTYQHHDHCPKVVLVFDTAKLVQRPLEPEKIKPRFPWDRSEDQ